jgi:hypothetical protein
LHAAEIFRACCVHRFEDAISAKCGLVSIGVWTT